MALGPLQMVLLHLPLPVVTIRDRVIVVIPAAVLIYRCIPSRN